MVPGFVAGHYPLEQCQIDIQPLLREAGARWISARCAGVDANTHSLMLDYGGVGPASSADATGTLVQRPTMLTYDRLSVDAAAIPSRRQLEAWLPGAAEHALPTQPSEPFVNRWAQTLLRCQAQAGKTWQFSLLGNSVQAIELAFAMRQGLHKAGIAAQVRLLTLGRELAPGVPGGMVKRIKAQLQKQAIEWVPTEVKALQAHAIALADGSTLHSDLTWLALDHGTPDWLEHSGLAQDAQGHVQVNPHLQSASHRNVFAAGACVTFGPRPQDVGAQADNAGADLALNLQASLSEQPLAVHRPSEPAIQVVACGVGLGVAQWGFLAAEGHWAWKLREKADRAFVARFQR
jgi:NADH dehydrogenase FAD-containing subunit